MAKPATFTAPLCIVKRNGKAIARIRSLRLNESIQRGEVQGLGNLTLDEVPPTRIRCSASFSSYTVKFRDSAIPDGIDRTFDTVKDFVDNFLLKDGIQLDLYKKVEDTVDENGIKTAKLEPFATIRDMFIDNDSMDVTEGNVSTRDQSFQYLTPVLYKDIV